jgi:hypothetical protein
VYHTFISDDAEGGYLTSNQEPYEFSLEDIKLPGAGTWYSSGSTVHFDLSFYKSGARIEQCTLNGTVLDTSSLSMYSMAAIALASIAMGAYGVYMHQKRRLQSRINNPDADEKLVEISTPYTKSVDARLV